MNSKGVCIMRKQPFKTNSKNKITIDFQNIVLELQNKNLKLCFVKNRSMFIQDNEGNLYQMQIDKIGSYLERLIKDSVVVDFYSIGKSNNKSIEGWEKEIWGVPEVKNFLQYI